MAERKGEIDKSVRIRLYGIVQGVGFRPFATRLAIAHGITGTVKNSGANLDITASGSAAGLADFYQELEMKKPPQAYIVHREIVEIPYRAFASFTIEPSSDAASRIFIPPDIAVCEDCMRELSVPEDARARHPFISCMSCGPRYSIIEDTPYDRITTSMREFEMCPSCAGEYKDRRDRRFHAQTISCHHCGPHLVFQDKTCQEILGQEAFQKAADVLKSGGILAIKGIGGYHLACSPYDDLAVLRLREAKAREHKPFAVMFPDMESIRAHCAVSGREEALLRSDARPIVLLESARPDNDLPGGGGRGFAPSVCSRSRQVGAFLWYTPLQAMLLEACGPLVMTSANVSGEPIINDDAEMLSWCGKLDGILWNTRKIVVRLEDSVVKVTGSKTQILRRSRGYAPLPVTMKGLETDDSGVVFAAGGQLKAAFCLAAAPFAYLSQHIGDLDSEHSLTEYRTSYERMKRLFRLNPEAAVIDMHPAYFSSAFAQQLGLPVIRTQHHHAHIASVMSEHGLDGPVIGVAFDGTGYGTDGAVWGGEFLVCEGAGFTRAGHLKYVKFLGGDEGMKDAAKSAMFHLCASGLGNGIWDARWPVVKAALDKMVNTHDNSSMGRVFDAVSAMLGICQYNRYEGECAIALENLAAEAIREEIEPVLMAFEISENEGILLADAAPVFIALKNAGDTDPRALALGFHRAAAVMTLKMCETMRGHTGITDVALSGGVFQNSVLLTDVRSRLENSGFRTYINENVPPNDGGICLGQAYIGLKSLRSRKGNGKCA